MGHAIEVEHLSKRYRLGEDLGGRTGREALGGLLRHGPRHRRHRDVLWSLLDVSLAVDEGEVLGVIGRNGAGKTTLLKVMSRITEPTSGVARTRGRVGSLLEVGTGFHPELTGRENIYLNGAILGLRTRDVDRRFDEIVAFAGVERFLDTPVKRYSSGMYLRLAFAVAAHIDTDILLVDEVLAVGDAEFQRKCLGKVMTIGRQGRTVVFVSHDLGAVSLLCDRAIWLDAGRIQMDGATRNVIDRYLASGVERRGEHSFTPTPGRPVLLHRMAVLDDSGTPVGSVRHDQPFSLAVDYTVTEDVPGLDLALSLSNLSGTRVLEEAFSWEPHAPERGRSGRYCARLTVPPVLSAGHYSVSVWFGCAYDDNLVWEDGVLTFRLEGNSLDRSSHVVDLGLRFDVNEV